MACEVFKPRARQQPERGLQRFDRRPFAKPRRSSPTRLAPNTAISRSLTVFEYGITSCIDHAVAADERMAAHPAELMHAGERAHPRPILDGDVPGKRGRVPRMTLIAHAHIVRHVRVGHQQVVAADRVTSPPPCGAAMNGRRTRGSCCGRRCAFRSARLCTSGPAARRPRCEYGKNRLSSPITSGLRRRRWPSGACRAPISTSAPMTQNGPISAVSAMRAAGSTMAVG